MITARTRSARAVRSGGETTNSGGDRRDRRRSTVVGRRRPSRGPCDGCRSNAFSPFVVWCAFAVSRVRRCRCVPQSFFRADPCACHRRPATLDYFYIARAFQRRPTDGVRFFSTHNIPYVSLDFGLISRKIHVSRPKSVIINRVVEKRAKVDGPCDRLCLFVCVGACARTRVYRRRPVRRSSLRKNGKERSLPVRFVRRTVRRRPLLQEFVRQVHGAGDDQVAELRPGPDRRSRTPPPVQHDRIASAGESKRILY